MTKFKIIALWICLSFIATPVFALTIKIGSPAPEGSLWDNSLRRMATEWKKISNGKVRVKIYPGGIVGTEADMVRKIRIGQLQAGVFTSSGLSKVAPDIYTFSLPKLIKNDAELKYILKKYSGQLDQMFIKKGFQPLNWSTAGWIYFFSKKPVIYPKDLKQQALAVPESDAALLQAWRLSGFNSVPLALNNVMTGLQSDMVDAYFMTPLASAAFQWFALANNMCDLKIAPIVGNILVSKRTWNRISNDIKPELKAVAAQLMTDIEEQSTELDKKALTIMKSHGLEVHTVPPKAEAAWNKEVQKGHKALIGNVISKDLYSKIQSDLQTFRESQ